MTKAELIEQIASDAGLTKAVAGDTLDALIGGIVGALKSKEGKISLTGFGTFSKSKRKARTGRNPRTGQEIKIKATNVVKFKPGKKLKEAV
jgi:DNA-binding protein HU-beta